MTPFTVFLTRRRAALFGRSTGTEGAEFRSFRVSAPSACSALKNKNFGKRGFEQIII